MIDCCNCPDMMGCMGRTDGSVMTCVGCEEEEEEGPAAELLLSHTIGSILGRDNDAEINQDTVTVTHTSINILRCVHNGQTEQRAISH